MRNAQFCLMPVPREKCPQRNRYRTNWPVQPWPLSRWHPGDPDI